MGMDNPNDSDYRKRENLHEEEPLYDEGPSELGMKSPHIVSFTSFNTPPPQEEEEEEEEEEMKKKRRRPWTRLMKRKKKRAKLGMGDPA
jgi:hypothetical protein